MDVLVNANNYVKVKVNESGIAILAKRHQVLDEMVKRNGGGSIGSFSLEVDEQGYTKFQLWDLMKVFGESISIASDPPFDLDLIFENVHVITEPASTTDVVETKDNRMTSEEVLAFILQEKKVSICLENGFTAKSDTEDVFRGLYGDEGFEEDQDMQDALFGNGSVQHTFFLSNATKESPFNEIGMVKRLLQDGQWTTVILHDRPIVNGIYTFVRNAERVIN